MLRLLLGQRLINRRVVLHASVSAFMILYEDARLVGRPIRVYENTLVRARPLTFFAGLTSLCSFYLSVISALVPLLSLPLTAQIAFGMYSPDPDYHSAYKLFFYNSVAACHCVR